MVKIAVVGGSGQIASEVIDVLVATGKHEIIILSRRDPATTETRPGVSWAKTDYADKTQLSKILTGVHTVLSFMLNVENPSGSEQKLVIDSAIAAGVKRFAPSEWSTSNYNDLPWYGEKATIKAYLEQINREKKVLEYTRFQLGFMEDYLVPAGSAAKHFKPVNLPIDFANRRAIILGDNDARVTVTTVKDVVIVVARAVEYEGKWPSVGGINGGTMRTSMLLEIGEKVRGGKPWDITKLKEADVRADNIKTPWVPLMEFPNVGPEQVEQFSKVVLKGFLLSSTHEAWAVSDEWNWLLPDYKFQDPEEFLAKHWAGKP